MVELSGPKDPGPSRTVLPVPGVVPLSLQAGTPVTEDTVATLQMQGITGLKYIELQGGTNEARRLSPGDKVQDVDLTK